MENKNKYIIKLDGIKKIKVNTEMFGVIQITTLNINNSIWFSKELKNPKNTKKELVLKLFHKLITKPKISLNEFIKISKVDLDKIILEFVKSEGNLLSFFNTYGDYIINFTKAFEKYDHYLNEKISNSIKNLKDIFLSSIINPDLISKDLISIQDKFKLKWKENINIRLLDGFHNITLRKSKVLEDFSKRYNISEEKVVKILRKHKWFISPSLPISFIRIIIDISNNGRKAKTSINDLFYAYFSDNNWENLIVMLRRWGKTELFKKRLKILRDCIEILRYHKISKVNIVNVVLPTLIVQVDGILTDFLRLKNMKPNVKYHEKKEYYKKVKSKSLTVKLDEVAEEVLLEGLFQWSKPGEPLEKPFYFNRHKILHGELLKYGRKDYLIRALLILDLLSYLE